jgi:hypothetical protein
MNPIVNTIAIANGLICSSIGCVLLMPSVMAFDAAPNVKPSMVILGCSGLSTVPCSILATMMSIVTGDLNYQSLHIIPYYGIVIGGVMDSYLQQQNNDYITTNLLPPTINSIQ